MDITYTYTIASVDELARCMEIVYEAAGHETTHVGARLPYAGESLEDVVKMYSPVSAWIALATPVEVPNVGTSGVISPVIVQAVLEPVILENPGPGFPINYVG